MRALDNLGLDIEQAVISCFNGFAMDVFRAEVRNFTQGYMFYVTVAMRTNSVSDVHLHMCLIPSSRCCSPSLWSDDCSVFVSKQQCRDGPGLLPEEIKAVLLHCAGLQSAM
jgi:hypothetical protein